MTVTASPQSGQQGTIGDAARLKAAGGISPWWYNWVDRHRVAGIALVGVIATQLGTYFGYVFPAVGLPTVPWPLYNGASASWERVQHARVVLRGPDAPLRQRDRVRDPLHGPVPPADAVPQHPRRQPALAGSSTP